MEKRNLVSVRINSPTTEIKPDTNFGEGSKERTDRRTDRTRHGRDTGTGGRYGQDDKEKGGR